ncbi:MAG: hypothetical protein ACKPKF_23995, partial [Microcystis panniformis]
PLDSETQSQQGFTKGDYPESSESPLVTLVTFSESPQDSDRPVDDTENLKPGDYCFYKKGGQCHNVVRVDGDWAMIQDYYKENDPFPVSLSDIKPDTPGPERGKKKF